MSGLRRATLCALAALVLWTPLQSWGKMEPGAEAFNPRTYQATTAAETPYTTNRIHRVGNVGLMVTNWATFGAAGGSIDACTGLEAPSLEFPINSGLDYLFMGALWVGAVKGRDTLTSLGADGWSPGGNEFFPRRFPEGEFVTRTTRPILRQPANAFCPDVTFSADAVSEQDFVCVYSDTLGRALATGGEATRGHIPLSIEVTQKTYSWSFDYAQDFIIMEMLLKNSGEDTLRDLFFGIYMDHDVGAQSGGAPAEDDITGFTHWVPSPVNPELYRDTVNLAWIADNDGDPRVGRFNRASATGVAGIRVVQAPGNLQFSFNWWVSNGNASRDWGPNKADSEVDFIAGNLGTPSGDLAKYAIMANGEFDYPQWEAALNHSFEGWLPPLANATLAANIADGFDTRYLLSFGPFDVLPDTVLPLTFALIAGDNFHADPGNLSSYFNPSDPEPWLSRLDQSDFALNALWAGWVYDTPGFDTDGDGTRGKFRIVDGDTAYYTGDGVPDYQGPPPPPSPSELRFETFAGKIVLRWNGRRSETTKDPFSFLPDFEGYRVYMSRTLRLDDFALLAQRDNINYVRRHWRATANRWVVTDPPFTLDSLKLLYDDLSDSLHQHPFHPDSFKVALLDRALVEILLDPIDASKLDTNYYYFERFDANDKVDDTLTARLVDDLGYDAKGVIRRVYPYSKPEDSLLFHADGSVTEWPYYEYEYVMDGLQLAEAVYFSVTAVDFGNPAADLSQLESSPLANATEVWPINSADVVKVDRPKPGVYPNPYRLMDDYNAAGWENSRGLEPDAERARKVTFTNVPDTCTISIWSLDGDLVRQLDHEENPGSSEASVAVWNLITRNTQAVKTGIYIYTIESRFGTDIGKLVIIR